MATNKRNEQACSFNFLCWYCVRLRPHCARGIWKRSFISPARPVIHTKTKFSKTLFKPEKFDNAGFASQCGRKPFWKQSLFCSNTNSNGDCCVFRFLRRRVDGKHLMRSETSAFKSLRSIVVWTGPEPSCQAGRTDPTLDTSPRWISFARDSQ